MEKLTDAEVAKALEICTDKLTISCPNACPFYDECENDLCALERHALELIKRKDAEIERLKADKIIAERHEKDAMLEDAKLRYKEIKADRDKERQYCNHYIRMIVKAKDEAYKEFAERLKETIPHYSDGYTTMECVMGAIRYIEKELTEGNNG